MILLPIGRDETEIQRHAWISYAIIAANVLVFILISFFEREENITALQAAYDEAVHYVEAHPYLTVPPKLAALMPDNALAQLPAGDQPKADSRTVRREQAELDHLTERLIAEWRSLPSVRFAYIPADGSVLTAFTSMFLHAGILHLVGNLLFFYLSGPFVEDVFGRPYFAVLYFLGGIAANLMYSVRNADSMIPCVGASGAIAAVMGAYLVRFARSKIEFLFLPFWWRPTLTFRFFAPAFVVLPLWFVEQLWSMYAFESADGGGVAFSAHIGGFVFGLAFAAVMNFAKIEDKYVKPAIEKQISWKADDRLLKVIELRHTAPYPELKRLLSEVLRDDPTNVDALRLAVDIANDNQDFASVDTLAARLVARYAELKQIDDATTLMSELAGDANGPALPKFFTRAAVVAERAADREWALYLYKRAAIADPHSTGAISALVKVGALLRAKGDVAGATKALTEARAHPACTAEWAPSIDAKLAQLLTVAPSSSPARR